MNWQLLPQFAVTGLLAGGPIALIALGLVLI
jgi:branched-subunit amino acid ABC-type transport system permease component